MNEEAEGVVLIVRHAPAKVNFTLAVVGRRPDGYHELHSIMATVGLADVVSVRAGRGSADTLDVRGPDDRTVDLGPIEENLVTRVLAIARRALADSTVALPGLATRLDKRIPVAAGLAGGSSDAAAALDAALAAWGVELDLAGRLAIALRVGSDVPFFLTGGVALVEGRGEAVTALPLPRGAPIGMLLVTPRLAVATSSVFGAYAAGARGMSGAALAASHHLADEFRRGISSDALLARAGVLAAANELIPATRAVAPELVGFGRALARRLGRPIGQSGSGPTAWVLYDSPETAEEAAGRLREAVRDGTLPVPGDGPPAIVATTLAPPRGGTEP